MWNFFEMFHVEHLVNVQGRTNISMLVLPIIYQEIQ